MNEIEIAMHAIEGNKDAQLQVLKLYEDQMYRVAFSYMRNEYDARDALQEMYYLALKNMHRVKSPEYFKTWLVRIVINTCHQQKRKQKGMVLTEQIEASLSYEDTLFEMNDILLQLTLEQQQLIHLKYFRDLKNREIATLQNIPEGTVKSRLHNTLKKLRSIMEGGRG